MSNQKPIQIAEDLQVRLRVLADQSGYTLEELTDSILRAHAESQERTIIEQAEDERRWQRYLETGEAHPIENLRSTLHSLAAQAAQKSGA